jgi:hypothetical protein
VWQPALLERPQRVFLCADYVGEPTEEVLKEPTGEVLKEPTGEVLKEPTEEFSK